MSPQKIGVGPARAVGHIGIGPAHAVTTTGSQRADQGHRTRPGIRLRLRAIPGLTPKAILRKPLRLPCVLGPDFEVGEEALHTDFDTVGAGQFSSPAGGRKAPQLKTLSFDALTLTWDAKWLVFPDTTPQEVRRELNEILRSRQPVELFAFLGPHGTGEELRMYATLRGLNRILRHGESDTRYYSLSWKQYRNPVVRRRGRGGGSKRLPARHKLKSGDTLRSLAKRYYGTRELWLFLASENGIKGWGGETPLVKMNRYEVGDQIKIPVPPSGGHVGRAHPVTGTRDGLRIAEG